MKHHNFIKSATLFLSVTLLGCAVQSAYGWNFLVYNAGIPVYPVMGNHEINAVPAFTNAFGADIPNNGPPGEINRTYAVAHSE